MTGILLLAVLQGSPLTHNFGVIRADLLVKEVSRLEGAPLSAPQFTQEFLYVNVKDMSSEDLLASLAKVLHGRWADTGSERRLKPVEPFEDPEAASSRRGAAAFMAKALPPSLSEDYLQKAAAALKRAKEPGGPAKEDLDVLAALDQVDPFSRAAERLVKAVGLDEVCSLGTGGRRVYALRPTSSQSRLPLGADQILADLAAESGRAARMASLNEGALIGGSQTRLAAFQAAARGNAGVELVIETMPRFIMATLRLFEPSTGAALDETSISLTGPVIQTNTSRKPPVFDLGLSGKTAVLPKDRPRLFDFSRSGSEAPPDARIIKAVSSPEEGDLLSVTTAPVFDEIVRQTGRGLICIVPDQVMARASLEPLDLGRFVSGLRYGSSLDKTKVEAIGQNSVIVLDFLGLIQLDRYPRQAIAALVKRHKAGARWLDCLAAMASEVKGSGVGRFSYVVVQFCTGRILPDLGPIELSLLRCWSALSPQERQEAEAGGAVRRFGQMSPLVAGDASLLNWGIQTELVPEGQLVPAPGNGPAAWQSAGIDEFWTARFRGSESERGQNLRIETTRAIGLPLDPDSRLRIAVKKARAYYRQHDQLFDPASPDDAAMEIANAQGGIPPSLRYVTGTSTLLSAECIHPGRGKVVRTLVVDEPDRTAKPVAYSQMPEAFQSAVQAARKKLAQDAERAGGEGGGPAKP